MILSVRYGNCSTRVDLSYLYYLRHWRHLYYAVFQGILSDFIFPNIMLRYVNGIHLSAMWQNTTIVQSVIHRSSNYNKSRPTIWADTDIGFIMETTVHSARRSEYDAAIKLSSGNIIEWFRLCNSSLNKKFPENTSSWPNVGVMLGHCLRRCPNITPPLASRLVFPWPLSNTLHTEPSLPQGPIYVIIKQTALW